MQLTSPPAAALAGFRSRLRNASFAINQRAVSGTVTLAAGVYGHDGVKAGGAGATYTFATTGLDTTLTITAGSLILPVEAGLIEGGSYAVSQAGTAQARVWQGTGSTGSGSYAAAPFVVTGLTSATQTNLEFSTGTVLRPQVEPGSTVTAFERRRPQVELADCQRYYEIVYGSIRATSSASGNLGTHTPFVVPKRAVPTVASLSDGPLVSQTGKLSVASVSQTSFGVAIQVSGLTASTEYYNFNFSMTASAEV
jgi:hypothetical protein